MAVVLAVVVLVVLVVNLRLEIHSICRQLEFGRRVVVKEMGEGEYRENKKTER